MNIDWIMIILGFGHNVTMAKKIISTCEAPPKQPVQTVEDEVFRVFIQVSMLNSKI